MSESILEDPAEEHRRCETPQFSPNIEEVIGGPPAWVGKIMKWALPVAFLIFGAFVVIPGFLQKWFWMKQLNYEGIFWTLFSLRWGMTVIAFLFPFLFLWINIRLAAKRSYGEGKEIPEFKVRGVAIAHGLMTKFAAGANIAFSAMFAAGFYSQWDTYLRFRYGASFGLSDPIFGRDLAFYLFRLPFYQLLQSSIVFLAEVAIVSVILQYVYLGLLRVTSPRGIQISGNAVRHISVLLALLVVFFGWGFCLARFNLLYSTTGVVYGVGYTADHVNTVALMFMVAVCVASCAALVVSVFRPRLRNIGIGAALYAACYLVSLVLVPAVVQKFVVQPNELRLETPYLKSYIEFTRRAYKLDAIQETAYPALADLTTDVLARNQDTIQNIRLWDKRPLLQTYEQTQAIRLYYQFYKVDVDRYHLADGYHQVMLSTRELSPDLPDKAKTWVNQNLQFTHGYGIVMNFVSKSIGGGFPQFLVQNVPPESSYGLNISEPAIYYGEGMEGTRIVATGVKEFDYPKGNENVYTSYHGKGGIPLDSLAKRVLFTLTQGDINILLTSYLRPESRIQIWRDVQERISQVAPFLKLDADPYAVLSEGKLYWIQDAYTTSDRYPIRIRTSLIPATASITFATP